MGLTLDFSMLSMDQISCKMNLEILDSIQTPSST